jgi:hypothetical protein
MSPHSIIHTRTHAHTSGIHSHAQGLLIMTGLGFIIKARAASLPPKPESYAKLDEATETPLELQEMDSTEEIDADPENERV